MKLKTYKCVFIVKKSNKYTFQSVRNQTGNSRNSGRYPGKPYYRTFMFYSMPITLTQRGGIYFSSDRYEGGLASLRKDVSNLTH